MTTINQLPAADAVLSSDMVPIYSSSNGDARKASMTTLLAFFQRMLTAAGGEGMTQYASPNTSGFSVTVAPAVPGAAVWLLLTQTSGFQAGTINLPAQTTLVDRQEVEVSSLQSIGSLTVSGGSAPVNGAPTALAANGFFGLRYDAITRSWYRFK